ncbi:MAG: Rho termination factor N-terminal domain-containing protein, partial [Candidatus Humimicrobiaceae bacterium]
MDIDNISGKRQILEAKTISDLQVIAKNLGISGLSRLKKSGLIEKILAITDPQPQSITEPKEPKIKTVAEKPPVSGFDEDNAAAGSIDMAKVESATDKVQMDDSFVKEDFPAVSEELPEEASALEEKAGTEKEKKPYVEKEVYEERMKGILDILGDGYGFLRTNGYLPGANDIYVSQSQIRKFHLRQGDEVYGVVRPPKDNEKYNALLRIEKVDGMDPDSMRRRVPFEALTPIYPMQRLRLETVNPGITARVIDLVAPIGKGQRGLIVSPPKAGKTTILKDLANSIATNNPEVYIMVLLVDE